jgi:hypothetical protein
MYRGLFNYTAFKRQSCNAPRSAAGVGKIRGNDDDEQPSCTGAGDGGRGVARRKHIRCLS